jgi:hypothetical protein
MPAETEIERESESQCSNIYEVCFDQKILKIGVGVKD